MNTVIVPITDLCLLCIYVYYVYMWVSSESCIAIANTILSHDIIMDGLLSVINS